MEGITEKLDEADDIAEVIDLMQNLSILQRGKTVREIIQYQ